MALRISSCSGLWLGLIAACALAAPARAIDCSGDSVGLTPLNDLGTQLYVGFEGGLYPGGSNERPPGHRAAGLALAGAVAPLDTLGNPDSTRGRVVLISIGMSNTNAEFQTFLPKAMSDPARSRYLQVVNCAQGGQSADVIADPAAAYWDTVAARLRARGSSPRQAQVVWLKEAVARPTGPFPESMDTLRAYLGTIVRILLQKLPNVRICYLTSRIYAGYADTNLNPEPYAYESGFAVKGLILDQMNGEDSLNFDPDRGPVHAPWLTWGPYLWADGLRPRSDGLTWLCSDFASDGTHPGSAGREKVADSLLAFMKRDETATPWFLAPGVVAAPATVPAPALEVRPNPTARGLEVTFASRPGEEWRVEVFDAAGRRVAELGRGTGSGGPVRLAWDGADGRGRRVRPGMYFVKLVSGTDTATRRSVLVAPG